MTPGSAPELIETPRLSLRRPRDRDADAIFSRYSSDPEVTRLVGWPTHQAVADARAFIAYSEGQWTEWPAGPYLIETRRDGALVGGTGLAFETSYRAQTGYVLAKDAWGRGLATEALEVMVGVARDAGVRRLYALCHHTHRASARVLEKCDFAREGVLRAHLEFPNLAPVEPQDVLCYAILL
jgi:ribosomal-protein-alanine N-acetyltransferase